VHGLRCYGNITRTRNVTEYMLVPALCLTFRVSRRRRRREMYSGHGRLCVCPPAFPHYCTDPDVTWKNIEGIRFSCALLGAFAIGARVSFL